VARRSKWRAEMRCLLKCITLELEKKTAAFSLVFLRWDSNPRYGYPAPTLSQSTFASEEKLHLKEAFFPLSSYSQWKIDLDTV
jgi:hypothetical protein